MLISCASWGPHIELGWVQLPLRLTGHMAERWTPERWTPDQMLGTVREEEGEMATCWVGVADAAVALCAWLPTAGTCDCLPVGFLLLRQHTQTMHRAGQSTRDLTSLEQPSNKGGQGLVDAYAKCLTTQVGHLGDVCSLSFCPRDA